MDCNTNGTNQCVVINEVLLVPASPNVKYVELYNRGPVTVNLGVWWTCDQPLQRYRRLLKIPSSGPDNGSGGIMLGPNDYLIIRSASPSGMYSMVPNIEGSMTHSVNNGTSGLALDDNNFSMWDVSGSPSAPDFNLVEPIRDFVAWASDGVYPGFRRGCNAFGHGIWSPPLIGECYPVTIEPVEMEAVVTTGMVANSNISINYNGQNNNNPADYFLAPATPGARNVMPGDLDADFDIDNDDFTLFSGCFMNAPATAPCFKADTDSNSNVDCIDWAQFLVNWSTYSPLPPPSFPPCEVCLKGDFNLDTLVDGDDIQLASAFYVGTLFTPEAECASDYNTNGMLDAADQTAFIVDLLQSEVFRFCSPGDFTGDMLVDGDDIDPMLAAYNNPLSLTPEQFCRCDINGDLAISAEDLDEFVVLLMSGGGD